MQIRGRDSGISITWQESEDEGEGVIVATVTDSGADATVVELVLTDWSPGDPTPTVKAITVRKQDGVTARDLRIPLQAYLEAFAGPVASLMELAGAGQRAQTRRQPRRRRKVTDEHLAKVADAYQSAPEGERIAAVKAVEPASDSQVYRWLKAARERGILTDDQEGGDDGER